MILDVFNKCMYLCTFYEIAKAGYEVVIEDGKVTQVFEPEA